MNSPSGKYVGMNGTFFAPPRSAHLRFAPPRFAPPRSAHPRFSHLRFAHPRFAPPRSAHLRFAHPRSAHLRSAHLRFAPLLTASIIVSLIVLSSFSNSKRTLPNTDLISIFVFISLPHFLFLPPKLVQVISLSIS